ncbi:hypothetical protein A1O3_09748 [Capronia epimyces CBS 606.96]|uniref:Uncharacterized protein n=1 Tax=Capronia epimyces CBS 606.96 TaxID=1182542 RepID=W9XKM3_9EURO|nr:uncharacterized protein A1O3_09748 [Capronia epimyces CBS 606.96]EXJ77521.1 hypothetical protein A1O3_09748 [Capronia epimyces CBS 606.96]
MTSSTKVEPSDIPSSKATGQAYLNSASGKAGSAMDALSASESWGAGPANLLPVRFTDESLIHVPVLRPEDMERQSAEQQQQQPRQLASPPATEVDGGRRFSFFRRKSSKPGETFTMRRIPRREYMAHYAKDDAGKYIGTEDPADDCILRGEDLIKYRNRGAVGAWKNTVSKAEADKEETQHVSAPASTGGKLGKLFKGKASKDAGDSVIH